METGDNGSIGSCNRDINEAARFGCRRFDEGVGSCDSGDTDGEVGLGSFPGSVSHFDGGWFGDGTECSESF